MSHQRLNSTTILVIEDSLMCQALIKAFLRETGTILIMADTGGKALKLIKNREVDLVITDLRLPDTNGVEILKTIKHNYPDVPVIVQTASNIEFNEEDCIKAGCDAYITKPYSRSVFIDTIICCIQKKNIRQADFSRDINNDGIHLQPSMSAPPGKYC